MLGVNMLWQVWKHKILIQSSQTVLFLSEDLITSKQSCILLSSSQHVVTNVHISATVSGTVLHWKKTQQTLKSPTQYFREQAHYKNLPPSCWSLSYIIAPLYPTPINCLLWFKFLSPKAYSIVMLGGTITCPNIDQSMAISDPLSITDRLKTQNCRTHSLQFLKKRRSIYMTDSILAQCKTENKKTAEEKTWLKTKFTAKAPWDKWYM